MIIEEMTDELLEEARKELNKKRAVIDQELFLIELELEKRNAEPCDGCKKGKLVSAPGGGVVCSDRCGYWFCY